MVKLRGELLKQDGAPQDEPQRMVKGKSGDLKNWVDLKGSRSPRVTIDRERKTRLTGRPVNVEHLESSMQSAVGSSKGARKQGKTFNLIWGVLSILLHNREREYKREKEPQKGNRIDPQPDLAASVEGSKL